VGDDLPPGWYWRYPWPIRTEARVLVAGSRRDIGFKSRSKKDKKTGALTWTSAHRKETREPKER